MLPLETFRANAPKIAKHMLQSHGPIVFGNDRNSTLIQLLFPRN